MLFCAHGIQSSTSCLAPLKFLLSHHNGIRQPSRRESFGNQTETARSLRSFSLHCLPIQASIEACCNRASLETLSENWPSSFERLLPNCQSLNTAILCFPLIPPLRFCNRLNNE